MTLKERFVKRVADRYGHNSSEVETALNEAMGDRPFLDWLRSDSFKNLVLLILNILAIFAEKPE